ncbi:MAG: DUF1501 domain-containing protein [Pirellulaceae bacterium]|nr:DUF1501 domain-containing protein [Pirellulaceae bacterium]
MCNDPNKNSQLSIASNDLLARDASCVGFQRFHRRRLLQSVAAVSGAGWLTGLAEKLARSAELSHSKRPKSLLVLWLQGGPSQLETFDPHPGSWIGGEAKAISTSIPNVQISDFLPATAEQMHHACLVRSLVSKEGDHERATYHVKTGWRPDPTLFHPSIGAILCHQSESNVEIPRHISILSGEWPARGGYLGPSFDAFQIGDPAKGIPNLKARVDEATLARRSGPLLRTLETEFQRGRLRDMDRTRTQHQAATDSALTMMTSPQLSAFDIDAEGGETKDRFGDTSFGRGCLAAIRLLETGVRCVEVELNGWDSHINNHALQMGRAEILDAALAATLQELHARDMLDDTIVYCGGEFGRTPQINPAGGRDHWPHGFSALLAGGGFRRGYVHGATVAKPEHEWFDKKQSIDPTRFAEQPVTIPDLHATLLNALGVDHTQEQMTPVGRPLRWSDGKVATDLLS